MAVHRMSPSRNQSSRERRSGPCSESESSEQSFFSLDSGTVPREIIDNVRTVSADPESAGDLQLERGQYRITFTIPWGSDQPVYDRETMVGVPQGDEFKRFYVYKASIRPIDEVDADGRQLARGVVVFNVLDNPLPVAPIIWGTVGRVAPWIFGTVGGWFLVDKVESFSTESLTGAILTTLGALTGVILLWVSISD